MEIPLPPSLFVLCRELEATGVGLLYRHKVEYGIYDLANWPYGISYHCAIVVVFCFFLNVGGDCSS